MKPRTTRRPKSLEHLDLHGWGHFPPRPKAAFTIETLNLPASWEYLYQNGDILLRVDQLGPVSTQLDPPKDIVLFRREPFQRAASWLVWLRSPRFRCRAFTNFFRPLLSRSDPAAEPDRAEITFTPAKAVYTIEYEGLRSVTELFVPSRGPAVCLSVALTNLRKRALELSVIPALRPYANPALLAPWDKPEWYLKNGFCLAERPGFWTHLLNMNSEFEKRRVVALWSDREDLRAAEISYEHFIGAGTFENPEAVFRRKLRLAPEDGAEWGTYREENTLYGVPPVYALQYDLTLHPGETRTFRQVLASLPLGPCGSLPDFATTRALWRLLDRKECLSEQKRVRERYERFATVRTITTPDRCLNRYVNEWLPRQLDWVTALDRGWPTGMRGSRDSANDFTALVPLDPARSRAAIAALLSCQRSDGWFPRQYSASGRQGKHDLRGYVDAGCVVTELLYEYLCFSKDFALLEDRLPWLDSDEESPVLEHALRAMDFFLDPRNLGEHGLSKIGEGDWLDAVNRAGVLGRGESVTVTNQVIIALAQLSGLLKHLQGLGMMPKDRAERLLGLYARKTDEFRGALRAHALNAAGYFNSVFNDDGRWLFSDRDPDGVRRVYGPANWFAIISGVAVPDLVDSILKELSVLRCPSGYRLFWPPMGEIPISRVGRVGTGDVPPGLNENATPYNHGAHGFLGRALAVAGKGDLLYDVLQSILPYDQERHPVAATLSPPYAVVNCWQDVPHFHGRGGMQFLTGSIAYAARLAYSWMLGIRPMLHGLAIDPCVPSRFRELSARFPYLGHTIELTIESPEGREAGVRTLALNGKPVAGTITDPASRRKLFIIPDRKFTDGANRITGTL